jgi:hypothetical protein
MYFSANCLAIPKGNELTITFVIVIKLRGAIVNQVKNPKFRRALCVSYQKMKKKKKKKTV